jgi:rhamnose utilization protein RhaD (predicted bifunctional aldolase and dehydrogenase)
MHGSHVCYTSGDTAYESYINTLEVIERCAQYLEDSISKKVWCSADKNGLLYQKKSACKKQRQLRRYCGAFARSKHP